MNNSGIIYLGQKYVGKNQIVHSISDSKNRPIRFFFQIEIPNFTIRYIADGEAIFIDYPEEEVFIK